MELGAYALAAGAAYKGYEMYQTSREEFAKKATRRTKIGAKDIVIAGAGFSGICMGIKLKEAGIPFTIIEKKDDVGGTWYCNQYPGCACDIPAHLYSFSFEHKTDWSEAYAPQPEIHQYLRMVVDKYHLRSHIRFNCAFTDAKWNETDQRWDVECSDGSTLHPRFFINALGPLHVPSFPEVDGLDTFQGPSFHSAEWDPTCELKGKRVAVVGSAASAVQLVPHVAKEASQLVILQRTPNWISKRTAPLLPKDPYSDRVKWVLGNIPLAERLYRLSIYTMFESLFFPAGLFDRSGTGQKIAQWHLSREMSNQLNNDAELIDKVVPKYPVGCKRICRTDDYLPTLLQDHVELVAAGLDRVEPDGIVASNGEKYQVDVIIYATGFKVGSLGAAKVHGKTPNLEYTGMDMYDQALEAYLGLCCPEMPNAFLLLGPNTGLGHNSVVMMMESQAEYITRILCEAIDNDISRMEVKQDYVDEWYQDLWSTFDKRVWKADCGSWYQNKDGKVVALWPGTTFSFFNKLAQAPGLLQAFRIQSGNFKSSKL